jgi:hypothetical protein
MKVTRTIDAINLSDYDPGDRPPAELAAEGLRLVSQWFAGDDTEGTAVRGLAALCAAFERCAEARDFDLGVAPGAWVQLERLAERLEALGWRKNQFPALAARFRQAERVILMSYGALTLQGPDGRKRVIYASEVRD